MNMQELKNKVNTGIEWSNQYDELRDKMSDLNKEIEARISVVRQSTTIKDMEQQIKETATRPLKRTLIEIFDNNLTKLISKRVVIELDENGHKHKISMSYAGMSNRERRSYYWRSSEQDVKFDYLPTMSDIDEKWNDYLELLDHYIMLRNRLHKRDKKEIMTICGKFVKQYRQLTHMIDDEPQYHNLGNALTFNYIEKTWHYGNFNYTMKQTTFNRIKVTFTTNGINIRTFNDTEPKKDVDITAKIDFNDTLFLLELMNDDNIRSIIMSSIDKFRKSNQEFRQLAMSLKEELEPYAILELL